MDNKEILLPNKKYIGAPDKDIKVNLSLENKSKNLLEDSYNYTINANDQYTQERQNSTLFRPYIKLSNLYYSNGTLDPFFKNYYKNLNTNFYLNKLNEVADPYNIIGLNRPLTNVDFLYDPIKTLVNENLTKKDVATISNIFSLTAPYDDIIITNISPLLNYILPLSNPQINLDVIDYWYLPTDIKKDSSYTTDVHINAPGDPIIINGDNGWINIGTFSSGSTESLFNNSNVIQTPLFAFRGGMEVKIPKGLTYSFFVYVKGSGAQFDGGEAKLKTSSGADSVAGFNTYNFYHIPGDIEDCKTYQQYCWLNIWPDSTNDIFLDNVSVRDYYGWAKVTGDPYTFNSGDNITDGINVNCAFKGVINYKNIQREPYRYRSEKLLSYQDYFDSVTPNKGELDFIQNADTNWNMYSTYASAKDSINLTIMSGTSAYTFTITNGVPAKLDVGLTNREISGSSTSVYHSYLPHNLKIGDYVSILGITGSSGNNIVLGVAPVTNVGSNVNSKSIRNFTIKITGVTPTFIQIKRVLDISDTDSMSSYYVRKNKIIETTNAYDIFTPMSNNGLGNKHYYLTNKDEIDVDGLLDENSNPITEVSYFFQKKDVTYSSVNGAQLKVVKSPFYRNNYEARSGFISEEQFINNTTYETITTPDDVVFTNTYRDGSITPEKVKLDDNVVVFEVIKGVDGKELNMGDHITFTDSGISDITQSIVYRLGDDFNFNPKKYVSLFSAYFKKPIDEVNNNLSLLSVSGSYVDFGSSSICGSVNDTSASMVMINYQTSKFSINSTILYTLIDGGSESPYQIVGYEQGGLYAVINDTTFAGIPTNASIGVFSLKYIDDVYNIKKSDMLYDHYSVYHLDENQTKFALNGSYNVGDYFNGDIVEYNKRELRGYKLLKPQYLFKLKDLYVNISDVVYSATTSTYGKTDLTHPLRLRYQSADISSVTNIEDKKPWAIFNNKINIWQWRDLIPNGFVDEHGDGTNFPFLNGRHYVYNEFFIPIRSKNWDPISGNKFSMMYDPNKNTDFGVANSGSLDTIEFC